MSKQGLKKTQDNRNGYLARRKAAEKAKRDEWRVVDRQLLLDAVTIVLHDLYGFGPERLKAVGNELNKVYGEMIDMINEELTTTNPINGDPISVSKAKIDRILKQIVGEENFIPWEERYKV